MDHPTGMPLDRVALNINESGARLDGSEAYRPQEKRATMVHSIQRWREGRVCERGPTAKPSVGVTLGARMPTSTIHGRSLRLA